MQGVSFTAAAGSFVGICGERGSGKSTMFKLLLRLYDPAAGASPSRLPALAPAEYELRVTIHATFHG